MVLYNSTTRHRTQSAQPSLKRYAYNPGGPRCGCLLWRESQVWHGCSLRTMLLLIMLSPQLTGHGQQGCTLCPGFLLLSRNIDVCSLGVLKCSLILCFWTNTVSLPCMISNSSFNPNSLHYTQRLGSRVRTLGQLLTHQCHFQAIRM